MRFGKYFRREDPRAQVKRDGRRLGLEALAQAMSATEGEPVAISALAECNERWGLQGLAVMMQTWVDVVVTGMVSREMAFPVDRLPFAIADHETGEIVSPDTAPELAWSARLIVAARGGDVDTVNALLSQFAALSEAEMPGYILALLGAAATHLQGMSLHELGGCDHEDET